MNSRCCGEDRRGGNIDNCGRVPSTVRPDADSVSPAQGTTAVEALVPGQKLLNVDVVKFLLDVVLDGDGLVDDSDLTGQGQAHSRAAELVRLSRHQRVEAAQTAQRDAVLRRPVVNVVLVVVRYSGGARAVLPDGLFRDGPVLHVAGKVMTHWSVTEAEGQARFINDYSHYHTSLVHGRSDQGLI